MEMKADAVRDYQTARLKENASPKPTSEEAGYLLRMLGEQATSCGPSLAVLAR